jgi:YggT family protein
VQLIRGLPWLIVSLFFILLIGRLVLEWIQVFARDWRPAGVMLVVAESVYSVTDPPLKALRRVLPPLRLGSVSFDLAFIVLFLVVIVLLNVLPQ